MDELGHYSTLVFIVFLLGFMLVSCCLNCRYNWLLFYLLGTSSTFLTPFISRDAVNKNDT